MLRRDADRRFATETLRMRGDIAQWGVRVIARHGVVVFTGIRRPSVVVPFGGPLLAGAIGLGILVDEMPPGEDGEQCESGPLGGVHPAEPVSRESPRHLPPSCEQTRGGEQEELEVKQERPAREPALPHGKSVDAVRRSVA